MSEPVVYENTAAAEPRVSPFVAMTTRELIGTIVSGLVVGLLVAVLYFLLNKFVFGAVLCRPQSPGGCTSAPTYSMIVALVLGTIAGVANLARMRVYRPLLVGLAAAISLWGIHGLLANTAWYWALPIAIVLFGFAYGLFAWLARIRNFIFAMVLTIVIVVIIRWILVA